MPKAVKNAGNYQERRKAAIYGKVDAWQDRVARLLVILLLCVHPLFFTKERYLRLTLHKYQFFCVCMAIILCSVVIIWLYRLTRKPRLLLQDQPTLADWAVIGFAIVTLLSAVFSPFKDAANVWVGIPEPGGRYDGAITQLLYVAAFLIVSRWYRPRSSDFVVFGISAALVGLIGILQFYGMDFLKLWPNHLDEFKVPNFYIIWFRSTLGNVDIVSTYVCVAILLCGFLFIRMKSKWRPLWLAASALNFWLMDLAGADSGRVGVLAAVVLVIPFIVEGRKMLGRTLLLGSSWLIVYTLQNLFYDANILGVRTAGSLLPYAVAAIALLAVGIALVLSGKEPAPDRPVKWLVGVILLAACIVVGVIGIEVIGKRTAESENPSGIIYEVREIMHGNVQDSFGNYRLHIWKNALKAYPEHPLIGSGPDTFYFALSEEAHINGVSFDKAHSEYIQILVCQGILGLLCYLIFLVSASLKAVPRAFRNPLLMAVLAAFVGYYAQAVFNISLPIVTPMLWVFAGMLANRRFREASVRDLA